MRRSARGFSSCDRPANDRSLDSAPPFSSGRRAMRFDGGAIDQNLRGRSARLRERVEHVRPHAFFCPSDEAVVERLPRSVLGRRIDPTAARLQHLHDATDHTPIINARFAARVGRQMWFDFRELRVCQPELIAIHPAPLRKP